MNKVYEEVSLFKNLEIFWMNNIKQLLNEAVEYDEKNYADLVINLGRGECPGVDDILLDLQNCSIILNNLIQWLLIAKD